jgi:hypothetical protein
MVSGTIGIGPELMFHHYETKKPNKNSRGDKTSEVVLVVEMLGVR